MTAKLDRSIALGMTAVVVAALSGCTNVNEAARSDMKPAGAPKAIASQQSTTGVAPATLGQVAAGRTAGTETLEQAAAQSAISSEQSQQPAVNALASSKSGNAASAAIDLAAGQGPMPQAKPQGIEVAALTPSASPMVAGTGAAKAMTDASFDTGAPIGLENEAMLPDIVALRKAVPMPRPDPKSAAVTSKSSSMTFAMLDGQFDVSQPGSVPKAPAPASFAPAPSLRSIAADSEMRGPTRINALVRKYASLYGMPENLIHRVIRRESRYNPAAYSKGNYGLMQIRYNTAKSMGYSGPVEGLFDAETNIKYAVKYLRGALMVAENNNDNAVKLYARGYYYDAKRKGLLEETSSEALDQKKP